jgi:opacity protein-like surface antigen
MVNRRSGITRSVTPASIKPNPHQGKFVKYDVRRTLVTVPLLVLSAAVSFTICGPVWADSNIDPYYAGGAIGQSSQEISNTERIPGGYLHAHPVGGKLLIGARPRLHIGGEFELIDFGRGRFGPNGDVARASSQDLAAAAFIVGYLPLDNRQLDLFAKIGAAVYRSSYEYAGDFSNECIVTTNTGICTPLSQFPTSGATTATGFAYGVGIQFHIGHYAIRGEYERIASPAASEHPPADTTRTSGLGLASIGVTYGF